MILAMLAAATAVASKPTLAFDCRSDDGALHYALKVVPTKTGAGADVSKIGNSKYPPVTIHFDTISLTRVATPPGKAPQGAEPDMGWWVVETNALKIRGATYKIWSMSPVVNNNPITRFDVASFPADHPGKVSHCTRVEQVSVPT